MYKIIITRRQVFVNFFPFCQIQFIAMNFSIMRR